MRAKGSVDARLVADGREIGAGTSAVTAAVRKALGMDHDTFFSSVFSCQRDLDALADSTPARREQLFMSMLGIERVDRALERVREEARTQKALLVQIDALLAQADAEDPAGRAESLRAGIKQISRRAEEARDEVGKGERELESLQGRIDDSDRRRAEASKASEESRALGERRNALEARSRALAKEVALAREAGARAAAVGTEAGKHAELAARRERMESEREAHARRTALEAETGRLSKEIGANEARLRGLDEAAASADGIEKELADRDRREVAARDELAGAEKRRSEAAGAAEAIASRRIELESHLSRARELGSKGRCPACLREFGDEHHQLLSQLDAQLKGMKREEMAARSRESEAAQGAEATRRRLAALEKQRRVMEEKRREGAAAMSLARELRSQVERAAKRRAEAEQEARAIKETAFSEADYKRLLSLLKSAESARTEWLKAGEAASRLPALEAEETSLSKEIEKTLRGLAESLKLVASIGFDEMVAARLRTESRDLQSRLRSTREAVLLAEKELARAEAELRAREADLARVEELKRRSGETRARYEELLALEALVKEFRGWLVSKVRPYVSDAASDLFAQVTDGRYTRLELDEKYEPRILDGGQMYPLGRFSGGERDLASLCIRLAVSRLLFERSGSEINLLVLDEVFGSQDPERRRGVLFALSQLSQTFRQILLITHVDDVKEAADSVIRVERGEEASRVAVE
jgi:exonuclease SbcC